MKIAKNVWFLLKNHQKPLNMRVVWAIFRSKAKLFLKRFFYCFVGEKKLYNIYEIQRGTPKNDWRAVDILKKIHPFSTRKMTSHEQYFLNNYR